MRPTLHSSLPTKGKAVLLLLLLYIGGMIVAPLVVVAMKPPIALVRQRVEANPCPTRASIMVTSPSHRKNGSSLPTSHRLFFHRLPKSDSEHSSNYLPESSSPIMTHQNAAVSLVSQLIMSRTRRRDKTVTSTATTLRGGSLILASSIIPPIPTPSSWILPAISCATCYALYNLFIKKASHSMDPILGGVLLQFVAAWIGTLLWISQKILSQGGTPGMSITKSGILWSVAAGVAVGAAEILSFVVSGKGVPATQSIPIIIGGSIVVGTILGTVWLQERMTRTGWLGVALIAIGITLVGMEGVGGH